MDGDRLIGITVFYDTLNPGKTGYYEALYRTHWLSDPRRGASTSTTTMTAALASMFSQIFLFSSSVYDSGDPMQMSARRYAISCSSASWVQSVLLMMPSLQS